MFIIVSVHADRQHNVPMVWIPGQRVGLRRQSKANDVLVIEHQPTMKAPRRATGQSHRSCAGDVHANCIVPKAVNRDFTRTMPRENTRREHTLSALLSLFTGGHGAA